MYWEYFGFEENPFSISPDPRYLYMSKRHQEALAHLLFGVREGGGFVLLSGEVGTGKTTICRCLIEELPDTVELAFVLNPRLDETELLATICDELHVSYDRENPTLKELVDQLNSHLLDAHARGRQPVLMIDEAQNLSPAVLEQVRLLTNLETTTRKLLQIVLVGQPELNDVLARKSLRQLDQRITARYHLEPLSRSESEAYVKHRLTVAGATQAIFGAGALREIYRQSGGVPRLINTLCDRCLLGAYAEDKRRVDTVLVRQAATEVLGKRPQRRSSKRTWALAAATAGAIALALIADPVRNGVAERLAALPFADRIMAALPPLPQIPGLHLDTAEDPESMAPEVIDTAAGPAPDVAPEVAPAPDDVALTISPPPPPPAFAGDSTDNPEMAAVMPMSEPPLLLPGLPANPAVGPMTALLTPTIAIPPAAAPGERRDHEPAELAEPRPVEMAALGLPLPLPDFDAPPERLQPEPEPELPAVNAENEVPDFAAVMASERTIGGLEQALAAVFRRWRYDYATLRGVTPCRRARAAELRCLQSQGTWRDLRYADRPAVITLLGPRNQRRHVALLSLRGDNAVIEIDGREVETTVAEIAPSWTGDFLLFWRAPDLFTRVMRYGHQGPDIEWLWQRLAAVDGQDTTIEGAYFNNALAERIRAFQRQRGLAVDGIVGPHTMIQLNSATDQVGAPSLR
jgi:general secretion pathway protein A